MIGTGAETSTATRYAGWLPRVGAALLDALIAAVPFAASHVIVRDTTGSADPARTGSVVVALAAVLSILLYAYNRWMLAGRTGQSWGKKFVGIRLVDEDGQPVGAGRALLRDVCHLLDSALGNLGYLWPLWDRKGQTFADKIMRTVVVSA